MNNASPQTAETRGDAAFLDGPTCRYPGRRLGRCPM